MDSRNQQVIMSPLLSERFFKIELKLELIQTNIDRLVYANNKVVTNFTDYYELREKQEISLKSRPNMLPYTLGLTTVGIGSIQVGDTFIHYCGVD